MRKLVLATIAIASAVLLTSFAPRPWSPAPSLTDEVEAPWLIELALAAPMVPGARGDAR